jgi:hypothetical protein
VHIYKGNASKGGGERDASASQTAARAGF